MFEFLKKLATRWKKQEDTASTTAPVEVAPPVPTPAPPPVVEPPAPVEAPAPPVEAPPPAPPPVEPPAPAPVDNVIVLPAKKSKRRKKEAPVVPAPPPQVEAAWPFIEPLPPKKSGKGKRKKDK